MPRSKKTKKTQHCQSESAEFRSQDQENNSNGKVFSDQDITVKEILNNLSFTPTFPKTEERPDSPVVMIVSDTEEPQDEDGDDDGDEDGDKEDDHSLSELSQSQSLNTSSADTVSVGQNSQPPPLEEEQEEQMEDDMDMMEATQIVDQSDPPSPDSQSLAMDQNSNNAKEKSRNKKIKNPGANYWMKEMIKSRSKPKKLDIEDPNFPFTSSQEMNMTKNPNPVETLKDFLEGISLTDQLVKTGVRHPAKLTRGKPWAKLTKKNRNLFLEKLSEGEGDCAPATSSEKAGKRSRASSPEETPEPSTSISTTSPVTGRFKRRKIRDVTKRKSSSPDPATPNTSRVKGKKEPPMGTCPICNRSMKCSVLEIHAGEAVTDL